MPDFRLNITIDFASDTLKSATIEELLTAIYEDATRIMGNIRLQYDEPFEQETFHIEEDVAHQARQILQEMSAAGLDVDPSVIEND